MSALIEYLKLIPKAMHNPEEVISGWKNVVKEELGILPDDILEEVVKRRLICGACPFMSANAMEKGIYKTDRKENHCILCSCPIKGKTAAMDAACGAKFYNSTHPDQEQLEVKWLPYESSKS